MPHLKVTDFIRRQNPRVAESTKFHIYTKFLGIFEHNNKIQVNS
jgi:hypothetical protein